MNIRKKIVTLGLVGIIAIGNCTSAFAATTFTFTASFGKPTESAGGLFHSMGAYLRASTNIYCLRANMKVEYTKYNVKLSNYVISAKSTNDTTKRKSAGASRVWTDYNSDLARVYDNYEAKGERAYTSKNWIIVSTKKGNVNELY